MLRSKSRHGLSVWMHQCPLPIDDLQQQGSFVSQPTTPLCMAQCLPDASRTGSSAGGGSACNGFRGSVGGNAPESRPWMMDPAEKMSRPKPVPDSALHVGRLREAAVAPMVQQIAKDRIVQTSQAHILSHSQVRFKVGDTLEFARPSGQRIYQAGQDLQLLKTVIQPCVGSSSSSENVRR